MTAVAEEADVAALAEEANGGGNREGRRSWQWQRGMPVADGTGGYSGSGTRGYSGSGREGW